MERQHNAKSSGATVLLWVHRTSRQHLSSALAQLRRWRQLSHDRAEMARMSDERLRDIGLSRADVMKEATRPFWDDPLRR